MTEPDAALSALLPLMLELPAGRLQMGTPERDLSRLAREYGGTRESYREESPQHVVAVGGFVLAETMLNRGVVRLWRGAAAAADDALPAAGLTWHAACAIGDWLSQLRPAVRLRRVDGRVELRRDLRWRLPTEAEWEYAARGTDGRQFPWGDAFQRTLANTREAGMMLTQPGAYPGGLSPFGAAEMAGTLWEWTASLDWPYPYRADDGRNDVTAAGRRILRGGCYANPAGYARCACRFRLLPQVNNEFLGLRPAADLLT